MNMRHLMTILTLKFVTLVLASHQACSPLKMQSIKDPFDKGENRGHTEGHGEAYQGKPYVVESKGFCADGSNFSFEIRHNKSTDRFWQTRSNCQIISPIVVNPKEVTMAAVGDPVIIYDLKVYEEFIDPNLSCLETASLLNENIITLRASIQEAVNSSEDAEVINQMQAIQDDWENELRSLDCFSEFENSRTAVNKTIEIRENRENLVVVEELLKSNWDGSDANVKIIIHEGVEILSNSTKKPAINAAGLTPLSTIEIINSGKILGKGGAGGTGEFCPDGPNSDVYPCTTANSLGVNGQDGGDAIYSNNDVVVRLVNSGIIAGGGGGGAGGEAAEFKTPVIREISGSAVQIEHPGAYAGGGNGGGGSGEGVGAGFQSIQGVSVGEALIGTNILIYASDVPSNAETFDRIKGATGSLGYTMKLSADQYMNDPKLVSQTKSEGGGSGGAPGEPGQSTNIGEGGSPGKAVRGARILWLNSALVEMSEPQGEIFGEIVD